MNCRFKQLGFILWIVTRISKLLYEKGSISSDLIWPK